MKWPQLLTVLQCNRLFQNWIKNWIKNGTLLMYKLPSEYERVMLVQALIVSYLLGLPKKYGLTLFVFSCWLWRRKRSLVRVLNSDESTSPRLCTRLSGHCIGTSAHLSVWCKSSNLPVW